MDNEAAAVAASYWQHTFIHLHHRKFVTDKKKTTAKATEK